MNETLSEILDVTAWILGGLFVGLTVLGGYNFYQEYRVPSVPELSLTPLQEEEIQPEQQENKFRSIDEFYLVQKHSPREKTEDEASDGENNTEPDVASEENLADTELPVTNLPYQLTGTTTGAIGFNTATIRQRGGNKSQVVTSGEAWNEFTVLSIAEEYIVIQNNESNRRERMTMKGKNG